MMRSVMQIASRATAALAMLCSASQATAGPITWVDWTAATVGNAGSASGSFNLGAGSITVSYSGDVSGATQTAGGNNYWLPDAPYLSATISNSPSPNRDIITIDSANGGAWNTLTFSTPVLNPVMALVSLGQPGYSVFYTFDQSYTLLSSGTGYWGGGNPSLFQQSATVLRGEEGHGAIQFSGYVSTISWQTSPDENWHGFTVGAAPVPEPASMTLVCAGLGLLAARARQKRRG
jgi:hypothetical protein